MWLLLFGHLPHHPLTPHTCHRQPQKVCISVVRGLIASCSVSLEVIEQSLSVDIHVHVPPCYEFCNSIFFVYYRLVYCQTWPLSFCSSLVPLYVQKRLFHFLNYSFKHSPLDSNLRYVSALKVTFGSSES